MKKIIKHIYLKLNNALNKAFLSNIFFRRHFLDILEKGLDGCNTVLEIGAGKSSYLKLIRRKLKITAVDLYEESLEIGLKNNIFDEVIIGDAINIDKIVHSYSFDAVTAFDFIEHLEKEEGRKFLIKCEKIARKTIIIFTPNGFLKQPPSHENPFQEHKSGWTYEEMSELNYSVNGVNGIKWLSGMYNVPKIKPIAFGNAIRNISAVLLKLLKLEKYSSCILCVKRKEDVLSL